MLAKVLSFGLCGIDGYEVDVEVDISSGLPKFDIVGLGDTAIKESKERIRSAIDTHDFVFNNQHLHVTISVGVSVFDAETNLVLNGDAVEGKQGGGQSNFVCTGLVAGTEYTITSVSEGDKVKVTIRFRGRELAHTELGFEVLNEVLKRLTSAYNIDKPAAMDGRNMSMTISAKAAK